jgi:N-acyl-D-amino-acid deacylase
VNVGYLIPAGTVRQQVCGYAPGAAGPGELDAMAGLVADGMAQGALGLSSGLDYLPGIHQDTAELVRMCQPVAAAGGLYVTHMRGGYEENSRAGTTEVAAIAAATGIGVHISHYHGPSALLLELVDGMSADGVDVSFDAYPYRRGCSLLAMPIMPPELLAGTRAEAMAALRDPPTREWLLSEWFPSLEQNPLAGPEWADNLTLAHIGGGSREWAHGMTVSAAAARAGSTAAEFALDVLLDSRLDTSVVMKVRNQRPYEDLARLFTHPGHTAGSDGIYIGRHPHPRAWGTFARFLGMFTRERGDYSWSDAARHLSGKAAERFGLADRGRLRPGYAADLLLVDPEEVRDRASYADPIAEAVGIDDVFVSGRQVLADGKLTGCRAGRGLRRGGPVR